MVNKYRKKPVVVEAIQITDEILGHSFERESIGIVTFLEINDRGAMNPVLAIRTTSGMLRIQKGDWIIKGIAGQYYPCKPEIFELTYEKVDD